MQCPLPGSFYTSIVSARGLWQNRRCPRDVFCFFRVVKPLSWNEHGRNGVAASRLCFLLSLPALAYTHGGRPHVRDKKTEFLPVTTAQLSTWSHLKRSESKPKFLAPRNKIGSEAHLQCTGSQNADRREKIATNSDVNWKFPTKTSDHCTAWLKSSLQLAARQRSCFGRTWFRSQYSATCFLAK